MLVCDHLLRQNTAAHHANFHSKRRKNLRIHIRSCYAYVLYGVVGIRKLHHVRRIWHRGIPSCTCGCTEHIRNSGDDINRNLNGHCNHSWKFDRRRENSASEENWIISRGTEYDFLRIGQHQHLAISGSLYLIFHTRYYSIPYYYLIAAHIHC